MSRRIIVRTQAEYDEVAKSHINNGVLTRTLTIYPYAASREAICLNGLRTCKRITVASHAAVRLPETITSIDGLVMRAYSRVGMPYVTEICNTVIPKGCTLFDCAALMSAYNVSLQNDVHIMGLTRLKSLNGFKFDGDDITLYDLRSVENIDGITFGSRVSLYGLSALRHLGPCNYRGQPPSINLVDTNMAFAPADRIVTITVGPLTASEMQIIRRIKLDAFNMVYWHVRKPGGCNTAHCLAGWAQYLTQPNFSSVLQDAVDSSMCRRITSHDDTVSLLDPTPPDEPMVIGQRMLPHLSHLFLCTNLHKSIRRLLIELRKLPVTPEESALPPLAIDV